MDERRRLGDIPAVQERIEQGDASAKRRMSDSSIQGKSEKVETVKKAKVEKKKIITEIFKNDK